MCVLGDKRYKTYLIDFFFCRLGHAPGVGLGGAGGGGVKNFSLGICDGAPSTAPSSLILCSILVQDYLTLS